MLSCLQLEKKKKKNGKEVLVCLVPEYFSKIGSAVLARGFRRRAGLDSHFSTLLKVAGTAGIYRTYRKISETKKHL